MTSRILLDEDIPRSCAEALRARGAHVVALRELAPRGISDEDVLAYAAAADLMLLTGQTGFGDLERFPIDARPPMLVVGTGDADIWAPLIGDLLLG